MSKKLSLKIAQNFLIDQDEQQVIDGEVVVEGPYGVNLEDYNSMDDDAAKALAQHKGDLDLGGLTSLSDAAAQALAQQEGPLYLISLTSLSDAAAQALAQHEGPLYLNGKAKEAVELARKRLPQTARSKGAQFMQSQGTYKCPKCGSADSYEGTTLVSAGGIGMAREIGDSGNFVGVSSSSTSECTVRKCRSCGEILGNKDYVPTASESAFRQRKKLRDHLIYQKVSWIASLAVGCFLTMAAGGGISGLLIGVVCGFFVYWLSMLLEGKI